MTFEEWVATERQHTDMNEVENAFGYTPSGPGWAVKTVVRYEPGTAVILTDGDWCTHVDRSECRGTADDVRKCLWETYAKFEVLHKEDE